MEMVHYVMLLLSLPVTTTALTVTAECVSSNAMKFNVMKAISENYVRAAIFEAINTTSAAVSMGCVVDVSDGTKKSLTVAFGTCETSAAVANTDMTMKLVVSESAAYTANGGHMVYSATCQYNANGNPLMTSVAASLTSNSIGGTPTNVPSTLTITTTAVDANGVAVTACTVGGSPSEFYLLSSTAKTASVEGIYMVSMSYMDFAKNKQTFMDKGCTTAGHGFIAENVGSKPHLDTPPNNAKVKARISKPIQCFRPHNVGTLTFNLQVGVCTKPSDARCATKGCLADARRRRDVVDGTIKLYNSTVVITPIRPEQDLNTDKLCTGYISSAVFYAVVIALAVLLVLTIGVAAFFGMRARHVVVREGKDNQSYS